MQVVSFDIIDFNSAEKTEIRTKKILFFKQKDVYYSFGKQRVLKLKTKDEETITIRVPADFYSNGITVPGIFKKILSPIHLTYSEASFYHDFLYKHGKHLIINEQPICISRVEADNIFYQILELCGTKFVMKWFFYCCVRLFGWQQHDQ